MTPAIGATTRLFLRVIEPIFTAFVGVVLAAGKLPILYAAAFPTKGNLIPRASRTGDTRADVKPIRARPIQSTGAIARISCAGSNGVAEATAAGRLDDEHVAGADLRLVREAQVRA